MNPKTAGIRVGLICCLEDTGVLRSDREWLANMSPQAEGERQGSQLAEVKK